MESPVLKGERAGIADILLFAPRPRCVGQQLGSRLLYDQTTAPAQWFTPSIIRRDFCLSGRRSGRGLDAFMSLPPRRGELGQTSVRHACCNTWPRCTIICCSSKAVDIADGLPPVLPIVLYNGDARWRQSSELYALIRPHPRAQTVSTAAEILAAGRRRLPAAELEDMQRVMAAIFCLNTRLILRRPNARFAIWRMPLRSLHSSNASTGYWRTG
ncbi:MAG: hypothetical protein U1E47_08285 [Rivihabitans pingtungensis]